MPKHFGQVVPIEDIERILALTDLGRAAGLHLPARRGRQRSSATASASALAPDGGGMAKLLGRDRRLLPRRAATRRGSSRCPRPTPWPWIRESEREGQLPHGLDVRHAFPGRDLQLLAAVMLCHEDDGDPQVAGHVPWRVPGPRRSGQVQRLRASASSCARSRPSGRARRRTRPRSTPTRCYGCGICRSACVTGAISLVDRAEVPAAASLWL
ncbi:MAG: hypothetical protein MZU79_07305 [Anaerotruncus sp.]|nr:hypothetical protein [Anaerotruncus sp.]